MWLAWSPSVAPPNVPVRIAIRVMPICTVDRKRDGSAISTSTSWALRWPPSAMWRRRAGRADTVAISAMANSPFTTTSSSRMDRLRYIGAAGWPSLVQQRPRGAQTAGAGRPARDPAHGPYCRARSPGVKRTRLRIVTGSPDHADDRAVEAGRERAAQDALGAELDDLGAALRRHRGQAADQDADAREVGEAA